jgi:superfamily II DNA or RNA helicase
LSLSEVYHPQFLDTSSSDLINDFFIPVLAKSEKYDRGVGYFSSGWLRLTAKGMKQFADNGGRARWVTSPILDEDDWEALQTGDSAREDPILRATLERNIHDLADTLEEDTLSALAWMVADEILDFRIALPRNKLDKGDFHDKFGIFTDAEGNQVSFNGSYNDSIQGTRNYESIKIFCSWSPIFSPLVQSDSERFEKLWNNEDPNVRVFSLPEAAREQMLRLRQAERPYPEPQWARLHRLRELSAGYQSPRPTIPKQIQLRDYQQEAIDAWFANDCIGLLEMATGTGKTIASLGASIRLYANEKRLALIIACPYQHLVDQWHEEAIKFGYFPLRAYKSRATWLDDLNEKIISYNHEDISHLSVITTHATFSTEHFQESIDRIKEPVLLIADEVHHLGSEIRRAYFPQSIQYRLALSATPDRWYDEEGTDELRAYFGPTVFELSLANAIGLSLTEYYYFPMLVELTDQEMEEYKALSSKIGRIFARIKDNKKRKENERLAQLLIKRARILNTAENKLEVISKLVDEQKTIEHTLFYCAPGQIDDVVRLLGWDKGLSVHRFTAMEDIPTRQTLLDKFAKGELQALVAMHCLDEGVDVPSTRSAFILASSSNPRQFIQRRGRVLRKAPGKDFAVIYDLITIPPPVAELDDSSVAAERSILRRELRRFAEFADSAINTQAAYETIWELAQQFGVLDF